MKKTVTYLFLLFCVVYVSCRTTSVHATDVFYFTESVQQTAATEDTVTLTWLPFDGADSYKISRHIAPDQPEQELAIVTGTTATVTLGKNQEARLRVTPLKSGTETSTSTLVSTSVQTYTLPAPLSKVRVTNSFDTDTAPEIGWEDIKYGNIEATVYNYKGKKITSGTSSSSWPYVTVNSLKGKMGYVVFKTYIEINGVKYYGKQPVTINLVPQPKITKTTVRQNKAVIKWKKVKGAKKYIVYAAKNFSTNKFKKIATVSASKNSYTFKKWNKKTINTRKDAYYIKVVAVGKLGKKNVKSTDSSHTRIHTY